MEIMEISGRSGRKNKRDYKKCSADATMLPARFRLSGGMNREANLSGPAASSLVIAAHLRCLSSRSMSKVRVQGSQWVAPHAAYWNLSSGSCSRAWARSPAKSRSSGNRRVQAWYCSSVISSKGGCA